MPNLIERLDAVLASLTTDDPKQANGKAMVFLLENNLTLREALRGEGRYRWLRDNAAPDLLNVLVSEWDFFRDAGEQLDAAIDQERGDRLGRDGGGA